jgi:hypothetical protein
MTLIRERSQTDRFSVVTNIISSHLVGLLNCLCGCSHRRATFPITLRARVTVDGQQNTQAETYIVCVECGRQFAYDRATMRIAKRPALRAENGGFEAGDRANTPCLAGNGVQLIGTP